MTTPGPGTEWQPPKTVFDPTTCKRKGLCPVTQIHHDGNPLESHSLYFEQHGDGPEKILFIMGLNTSSAGWHPQVSHFGKRPEYSVLVFDNRGVGHSGVPRGPYTTSGMAEDVITLLEYVGWTAPHDLHVVGCSMGGMIAQELAWRIPERIVSLTLTVTKGGRAGHRWYDIPPMKGLYNLMRAMTMSDIKARIPLIHQMLFTEKWLNEHDPNDPAGRTNREVQIEDYHRRMELGPAQTLVGSLSQMVAASTHYVSPERLRTISSTIPKVAIVVGDHDHMLDHRNSHHLKQHMPEAELIIREGAGHGLTVQARDWYNALLERIIKEGRERVQQTTA